MKLSAILTLLLAILKAIPGLVKLVKSVKTASASLRKETKDQMVDQAIDGK